MPAAEYFAWLMWPPLGTASAMSLSPGCPMAKKAAMLQLTPEIGCTLT